MDIYDLCKYDRHGPKIRKSWHSTWNTYDEDSELWIKEPKTKYLNGILGTSAKNALNLKRQKI